MWNLDRLAAGCKKKKRNRVVVTYCSVLSPAAVPFQTRMGFAAVS